MTRAGKPICRHCGGRSYLVCVCDDGRLAIERCDACAVYCLTDEQAAILARADGIPCSATWPCVITDCTFTVLATADDQVARRAMS